MGKHERSAADANPDVPVTQNRPPQPPADHPTGTSSDAFTDTAPHVLNHFVVRSLMKDIDPVFEVTDAAAEVVLDEMDTFFREVLADAVRHSANGEHATVEDVKASMIRLYNLDIDAA